MTDFWNEIFTFTETTATIVGKQLLKDFGYATADEKADGTLVTESDKWADQEITEAIAASFPTHGILSEEGQHVFPDTKWCWVIDPLDATTNFTRGIPIWGVCIGLLYRGTPVFGYIYLPTWNYAFHGFCYEKTATSQEDEEEIGDRLGAFLNNRPIRPSEDKLSGNHFFNLCSRSAAVAPNLPSKIRMLGMASYNFLTVAMGASIGGIEATPKIWDIAAAWAIVKAAGAVWLPLESEPIFPLKVGEDFGDRSFPTLIVSRQELVSDFLPFAESFKKS